jgi:hypothetical protein
VASGGQTHCSKQRLNAPAVGRQAAVVVETLIFSPIKTKIPQPKDKKAEGKVGKFLLTRESLQQVYALPLVAVAGEIRDATRAG